MEKIKKMYFWLLLCSLIQKFINIQPLWNSRGQGHLVILACGHISIVCEHFQKASRMNLLGQFHLNFICSLLAKGGGERKFINVV